MVMFAKHPKVDEYDLSSVKTVFCGAAPLSPEIEETVKRKLNLSYIQQGKFFDFSFSVKAAPHECVIRTGQP